MSRQSKDQTKEEEYTEPGPQGVQPQWEGPAWGQAPQADGGGSRLAQESTVHTGREEESSGKGMCGKRGPGEIPDRLAQTLLEGYHQ